MPSEALSNELTVLLKDRKKAVTLGGFEPATFVLRAEHVNHYTTAPCNSVYDLWSSLENWIRSLGMIDYHLTDRKKIIGDLENPSQINIILLNVKKTIYQSKLDNRSPNLLQVQLNLRTVFNHDYYKSIINDRKLIFERKWSLLLNFFKYKAN